MGAWIEIEMSQYDILRLIVAPLVGAWIEIKMDKYRDKEVIVAPLVGAWIEIHLTGRQKHIPWSLPLWERGLKFKIEEKTQTAISRSPCGSVD